MPSKTARATSWRPEASDKLSQLPRIVASSTGVRAPLSHGTKITPLLPGGAAAASALSSA